MLAQLLRLLLPDELAWAPATCRSCYKHLRTPLLEAQLPRLALLSYYSHSALPSSRWLGAHQSKRLNSWVCCGKSPSSRDAKRTNCVKLPLPTQRAQKAWSTKLGKGSTVEMRKNDNLHVEHTVETTVEHLLQMIPRYKFKCL